MTPMITLQPNANGQPAIYNFVPQRPGRTRRWLQPVSSRLAVQRHRLADAGDDSAGPGLNRQRPPGQQ